MSHSQVSVIIPVYNCESFLSRCITSIQNQTYKNWIAIFVNDGSVDRSKEIIENYSSRDPRIKLLNKNNGGAASARNAGLNVVQTPFITMLDADDTLAPDALELMVHTAIKTNVDIVVAATITKNLSNTTINNSKFEGLINNVPKFLFRNVFRGPFAKLYRKDIIERYHLRMPEDMPIAEDYVFVTSYWTRCKSAYSITKPLYTYNFSENENSLIHRFCRKELPFEAYLNNAEAPWRTFKFLVQSEKNKRIISIWTYELFRDLWKMSNNSCRYVTPVQKIKISNACKSQEREMAVYLPTLKRIFMPHRYPKISSLLIKLKKLVSK